MARKLRIAFPGANCHVVNRSDCREPIAQPDQDFRRYLETPGDACGRIGGRVGELCQAGGGTPS